MAWAGPVAIRHGDGTAPALVHRQVAGLSFDGRDGCDLEEVGRHHIGQ